MQGLLLQGARYQVETRWRGADLEKMDANTATELLDLLTEAGGFGGLFLRDHPSPWTGARLPDGTSVQDAVDRATRVARSVEPALMAALRGVLRDTGLQSPKNLKEASALGALLDSVAGTLENYRADVFRLDLDRVALDLSPARNPINALWSWCFKRAYRQAVSLIRSHRRDSKAGPHVLLREVLTARDQRKQWRRLARPGAVPLAPADLDRFRASIAALLAEVQHLGSRLSRTDLGTLPLEQLGPFFRTLAEDTETPYRLPRLIAIERRLDEKGVGTLVGELRSRKPPPPDWPALFRQAWHASCLDRARVEEPGLAGFNGQAHLVFVEEFKKLDAERLRLAAARVRRAHAERAIAAMNAHPDQEDLVRREAKKKTRHLPLRRLVDQAGEVLAALQPCWMASPLSVSQLLPSGRQLFDVVLFDEASQVLPEDAVPSIMRAGHAVVAGDEHQLPPTTFFVAAEDDVEEADTAGATEGYESILKMMSTFLRSWSLDWHYRSRDEALIAFSNAHIYSNRLVTFPGPGGNPSISHVLAPQEPGRDGQEESSSAEVRKVVALIMRHAEESPHETLGVIAMGIAHANRVQAALDQALRDRPDLDAFFDQSRNERFFIKNLERVQGDERDAIILTIGYGKDRSGKLPYRFGPLLVDGGERRLNVAVTRARQRMMLVSSFSHLDMDPARSRAKGVELLRYYLEYAASAGKRLGDGAPCDTQLNPFEQDVCTTLTACGLKLLPQWGASKYRIDLVAQHPTQPGRMVLAIECDGASYHAAYTARDRDRLRQQHLEALGWRFHRIWSTDWFMRRQEEIERTMAAFRVAVAHAGEESAVVKGDRPGATRTLPTNGPAGSRGPRPLVPRREHIDDYHAQELDKMLAWLRSDGRLRTDEQLIEEMLDELGFSRRGKKIEETIRSTIDRGKR